MPESKAVIALTWEPTLPALPFQSKTISGSDSKSQNEPKVLPFGNPINDSSIASFCRLMVLQGKSKIPLALPGIIQAVFFAVFPFCPPLYFLVFFLNRFDMPPPTLAPELKKDLQLLKVGTVVESVTDYYSGRMTKERKPTLADELLSDPAVRQYRKRKVREIEVQNQPAVNEKWKIKGR